MNERKIKRNHLFDNIKGVMLILVVVGHTLDPYITDSNSMFRYIMQYIYLFHMPMFAFVTGYFSKNADKSRDGAVKKVLIPYLLIQTVYIIVAEICIMVGLAKFNADVFRPSLLLPTSPLYYLLCVFLWKVFQKDLMKLRCPIIFAIISGVLISTISDEQFHIGVGATFSLLIFFVLGVKCTEEIIAKIRNMSKIIGVIILVLGIIPAVFLPYNFRNVRYTYASVGLDAITGIFYRLLFYMIAICMIVAIINLFPSKRTIISKIGEQSILVYAGSSFAAPTLYLLIARYVSLGTDSALNLLGIVLFSIIITAFFAMSWIENIYDKILKVIYKVIYKEST